MNISLTDDQFISIVSFLKRKEIVALARVSRGVNDLVYSMEIWRQLFSQEWPREYERLHRAVKDPIQIRWRSQLQHAQNIWKREALLRGILQRPGGDIRCLGFAAGQLIAGSMRGVGVWDPQTLRQNRVLFVHHDKATAITVGGGFLGVGFRDGAVSVWNSADLVPRFAWQAQEGEREEVCSMQFAGGRLYTSTSGTPSRIWRYDLENGTRLVWGLPTEGPAVHMLVDGSTIYYMNIRDHIVATNWETGQHQFTVQPRITTGTFAVAQNVLIAAGLSEEGIHAYHASSGEPLYSIEDPAWIASLRIEGDLLFAGSLEKTTVYCLPNRQKLCTLPIPGQVKDLIFHEDVLYTRSRQIICDDNDNPVSSYDNVKVWRLPQQTPLCGEVGLWQLPARTHGLLSFSLPPRDLCALTQVSKEMSAVVERMPVWQALVREKAPERYAQIEAEVGVSALNRVRWLPQWRALPRPTIPFLSSFPLGAVDGPSRKVSCATAQGDELFVGFEEGSLERWNGKWGKRVCVFESHGKRVQHLEVAHGALYSAS